VLQQHADRGTGEPFTERADYAAGNEDVLGHGLLFSVERAERAAQASAQRKQVSK
jgi:hypothetical protein